ncbi:TonB-dependent receptor [Marinomonas piezotolerans]|uniref:TonB-dependent receptor n=1 Tax=Marinomonas piezotolerans TaxID=2213058 RepID=A0A370U856_9GAMM|nr:TonB-dependent receptor [Marinomonas piezotolerans]RDL43954.1 TonB-dependent receptor [Marinomonas piezotolerans]
MIRDALGVVTILIACSVSAQESSQSLNSLDDLLYEPLPTVVTPAKVEQPRVEVSSTISVLDGDFIRRSNIQYVEDLLFFVPGFFVGPYLNSYDKIASFHGTELDRYRRIQVLVNGRSVYSSSYARVDWSALAVNVEDVERIEVNRGPNASSYGANSFLAVINIITRSPLDTLGTSLHAYTSNNGDSRLYGQHSGLSGAWSYRASASRGKVSGYETDYDGQKRNDGHVRTVGNAYIVYEGAQQKLDLDFGGAILDANIEQIEVSGVEYTDPHPKLSYDREHIKVGWERLLSPNHTVKAQYYYEHSEQDDTHHVEINTNDTISALFNGQLVSGETYYGQLVEDLDETRHDIELQSIWTPSKSYRLVNTVSYRQDEVYSKTYFDGGYQEELLRASTNLSYQVLDPVIINGGVMWEHSKLTGEYFSPQLGATLKLSEQASLRANVSQAYRPPDLYDQQAQWSYVFNGVRSIPANATGEAAEKITSYELGYFHNYPKFGMSYDVSVYREVLEDLVPSSKGYIDGVTSGGLSEGYTYDVTIDGLELEVDWRASNGVLVRGTAAFQETHSDEQDVLNTVAPLMSTLFASVPILDSVWFNSSYIYGYDMAEYDFKLLDIWLTYQLNADDFALNVGLGGSHRLDDDSYIRKDNISSDKSEYYLFANVSF